ncbi:hypothetical protein MVEN_01578800 [Mycena venus]|uniref:Granulins domain-containing protein n=1 Tax=Mycena venus TaxID=2733690 RepID=A0A8H6XRV4_9AGAR|nr:hypothetical protein MVEN_01578800 [Mycena venus]
MLSSPILPLLVALLAHAFTAAQHPLLPTAGGPAAKTPAKRIEGLLGLASRQFFCDPGYGICDNGCCRNSGSCCSKTGDCCPFAPNTAECCTFGGCCRPGEYCAADSKGNAAAAAEAGGGKTTTHKTTEKAPPPTTTHEPTTHEAPPPPTTTHETTHSEDHSDVSTPTPSPTSSGSTTPPPAGPGTQNVWTSVDSTQISWVGEWVSIVSTCNATSKAKRCSGESSLDAAGSMTYTFTGYSVAMSFSSSNLAYSVNINGKSWSFAETDASNTGASNCTYDVVYTVAAGTEQLISVEVLISDTAASNSRRGVRGADWLGRAVALGCERFRRSSSGYLCDGHGNKHARGSESHSVWTLRHHKLSLATRIYILALWHLCGDWDRHRVGARAKRPPSKLNDVPESPSASSRLS